MKYEEMVEEIKRTIDTNGTPMYTRAICQELEHRGYATFEYTQNILSRIAKDPATGIVRTGETGGFLYGLRETSTMDNSRIPSFINGKGADIAPKVPDVAPKQVREVAENSIARHAELDNAMHLVIDALTVQVQTLDSEMVQLRVEIGAKTTKVERYRRALDALRDVTAP